MSTHKRKGSEFLAASVTTGGTSFVQSPLAGGFNIQTNHSSAQEAWQAIQKKMQELRNYLPKDSDPVMERINRLREYPRQWQERIENLPYEAASKEEQIDAELLALKEKWETKNKKESAHHQRLQVLRSQQESLQAQSDELDADLHDTRDSIASHAFRQRMTRETQTQKIREMAFKIPKLQQQVSMYAMCTGIKWDYDNKEAWVGHVNVPSKQTYQSFHFQRDEVSSDEMMDRVWALMEG